MKKIIIIFIVAIIVVGGGAFYGGMLYGQSIRTSRTGADMSAFRNGDGGAGGNRGNSANFASGQIVSMDSNSITLKLGNNAGSKIIFFSGTTQIGKFTQGTSADLSANENVIVTGTANSDGSITAQSIQIRPEMPLQPGSGQATPPAQATP